MRKCSPMRPSSNRSSNESILDEEIGIFKQVSFDNNIKVHYYKKYLNDDKWWFKIKTFFKNIFK
jgi:hypothetical protein